MFLGLILFMAILVTGGAGFIGSHLADRLISLGQETQILDDLTSGKRDHLNPKAKFWNLDLTQDLDEISGVETVFHFAADPDVRTSVNPKSTFKNNVRATLNLLEWVRKKDVNEVIFASTSAVYGEAKIHPTPESHILNPISNYAASKLAAEAYLASYANTHGIHTSVLRLANIFGERSTKGVIPDFFSKLHKDPTSLHILGNGKQNKSYLYVSDVVDATIDCWKKQNQNYEVFNVGSNQQHSVDEIAQLVCEHMHLCPTIEYGGGEQGWEGDVTNMLLDTSKLENLGWCQKISLKEGIEKTLTWLGETYA